MYKDIRIEITSTEIGEGDRFSLRCVCVCVRDTIDGGGVGTHEDSGHMSAGCVGFETEHLWW